MIFHNVILGEGSLGFYILASTFWTLRLFELGEARLYAARIPMYRGIICRDRGKTDAACEHFEKNWST